MDISLYILANAGKEVKKTISSKICDMNSVEELDIPNINIICEKNGYRIKWFETGKGRVKRRGGNEDFGIKGRQLAGRA